MSSSRPNCLFVLSTAIEGVSAQSFIQAFTLTQTAFNVQLASLNGKQTEFIHQDENSRRWLNEFRSKTASIPIKLETLDASNYTSLVIPDAPGAVHDLAYSPELSHIISHFLTEKKPVCAIGMGVAALCNTKDEATKWKFSDYSMTCTSVYELTKTSYFGSISLIPEDFIKDHGAKYTSGTSDELHMVVDRHLVTAQNTASTSVAIQTFILIVNLRQAKIAS